MTMKNKRSGSLKTKLMAYFMLLIILPIAVLGYFSYGNAERALKSEAEAKLQVLLDATAEQINMKMERIAELGEIISQLQEVKGFGEELTSGQINGNTIDTLNRELQRMKESIAEISENILIIDKTGKIMFDASGGGSVGISVADREYFQQSMTGKSFWSDVLVSKATGNPVVVFSVPLKISNDTIGGVVAIAVKFDSISEIVAKVKVGEGGYGYLVDDTGLVLYHPVKEKILNENLLETADGALKEQVSKMTQGQTDKGIYEYQGVEKLNIFKPVANWSLAVNVPVKEYMAPAYKIRNITLSIGFGAVIIGLLIAYFASLQITNPVKQMMELMAKAESGDLTVTAEIRTKDEIGALANSFNSMVSGQRDAMKKVLDASSEVGSASQQTSSIAQEMASSAENQTASVEELTSGMNDMAKSIGEVASSITDIAGNIEQVSRAIRELGASADEVAKSAESTAATVVDVTASLQQMNATVEVVANHSNHASDEAEKTVKVAQDGKRAVDNTILEMDNINKVMANLTEVIKGLGKATLQIGDIVEVIDDIAEQTNLLSLNASIEAARAGEHGKGFAVVAGAIGNLAEKSSSATKDIANLIKQIQEQVQNAVQTTNDGAKQVENGVNLVKNTGVALDEIFNSIGNTTHMIKEIATSTKEQSKASKSIMEAIEKVNHLSMNVSAAVEEQVAAIEETITAIEMVNELSQSVASAAEEQSASSEQILATTENVNEMANEVSAGSEEVASTAQNLAMQANQLMEVVSRFKI
ncbi:MAG: methyl-accepting chemotaxis protein [Bacillota bacterium]